ncbi:MAG TPA: hypothetical protein VK564_04990, partial [Thermodesulfobacteriota bacterium]|nr:hypothetical protein [Thermodesulfobacteriota bacterium]
MPTYHYKDLSKILSEINTKKTVPIFLIAGDAFLTQEVTGKIIDQLLPAEIRSFNLEKVDGEKEDIYSLLERVQTFPFFPGPKIVLAINPVQLFSSGKPDRLWKKAEEAWQNGQVAHCVKLLRSLMQHAGISYSELLERGNPARAFMEKLFPERAGACPEWLSQVMTTLKDDQEDTLTPSSPDLILKSALEKGFPENHILIIQMEGDLGGKKVVNLIAQKGIVFNFSIKQAKKGEQTGTLKGYLSSRLSQERKSIHPKAEALLLERITPEIYQLEMELQ